MLPFNVTDWLAVQLVVPAILFLHGSLFTLWLRDRVPLRLSQWLDGLSTVLLIGFLLSMAFNIAVAFLFSAVGVPIQYTVVAIAACTAVCIVLLRKQPTGVLRFGGLDYGIWTIVAVVFVIMSANGGLIDVLADSWWHMSYVNQIEDTGSVFVSRHHLTGNSKPVTEFVYEPGWHVNIALISVLSKAPLPLIWHILGAWCTALTLLAYYFFANVLTANRRVATGSVVLFVVVLGGMNAYFRVSPWPGNVAYILMYIALALVFILSEDSTPDDRGSIRRIVPFMNVYGYLKERPALSVFLVVALGLIGFVHLAEGLWLVSALVFYSYGLTLSRAQSPVDLRRDRNALGYFWVWFFVVWGVLVVTKSPESVYDVFVVVGGLMAFQLLTTGCRSLMSTRFFPAVIVAGVVAATAFISWIIDFGHLWKLFRPEIEQKEYYSYYIPEFIKGDFGTWLNLPKWEHQLRAGLLFSGFAGVLTSVWLVVRERTRATVFLCACSMFAIVILCSPYVFSFFGKLVEYTGVYRYQVLIFHPIILALGIGVLLNSISGTGRETRRA